MKEKMENPSNNNDNKSTQRSISEKIQDYVLEHLLTVMWSFSLLIGGFVFWRYFFHIGYFPDLTGNESILLLPLAALTGVLFLLFLICWLMIPSVLRWAFLKFDDDFSGEDKKKRGVWEIIWHYFSYLLFIFIFSLLFAKEERIDFSKKNKVLAWVLENYGWIIWILPSVLFMGVIICYITGFEKKRNLKKQSDLCNIQNKPWKDRWAIIKNVMRNVLHYSFILFGNFVISFLLFIPFFNFFLDVAHANISTNAEEFIWFFGLYGFALLINGIYSYVREQTDKRKFAFFIPLAVVFLVFFWLSMRMLLKR